MNLINIFIFFKKMRFKGEINCDILVIIECKVYMYCY